MACANFGAERGLALLDRDGSTKTKSAPDVSVFALRALATLVGDLAPRKTGPESDFVRLLKSAIHAPNEDRVVAALRSMRASGITNSEIIGVYVPAVAHMLESDWQSDRVDFVGVTIVASRLQGIMRRLASDWLAPHSNAPRCLVSVTPDEQHTLGASVLTAQLRDQGLDVQLLLSPEQRQLVELATSGDFTAVMISSYDCNDLDPLQTMVKTIRTSNAKVPIIIGGSVLSRSGDVCRLVRADYATNNWQEAVRICGLKGQIGKIGRPVSGR